MPSWTAREGARPTKAMERLGRESYFPTPSRFIVALAQGR
jgi:hypothetical protein